MKTLKPFLLICAAALGFAAFGEEPDAFIQFVQNDGTQYFDTGVIGKAYTKAEIDFYAVTFPANGTSIFGSKASEEVSPWYYNWGVGLQYDGKLINSYGVAQTSKRYRILTTIEPGNQTVYWYHDDVTKEPKPPSSQNRTTDLPMYLFARNDNGTATLCDGKIRLYGLKIWQKESADGEYQIVRDYRPAVKDGKRCLYDAAHETIIYPKASDGSEGTVPGSSFWKVYATDKDGLTPIQQLTNAVASAANGDVIELARGTYKFPDDVFMADNTRKTTSPSYCKIRLNVKAAQSDIIFRGEDASSRSTWTHGKEPVIIDGNGGKALQLQLNANASWRIENITFVNCNGGAYGNGSSSEDSLYGNWCNGGAIGIGKMANPWQGGDNVVITNCAFRGNQSAMGGCIGSKNHFFVQDCFFTNNVSSNGGGCLHCGNASGCDFVGNGATVSSGGFVRGSFFAFNDPKLSRTILAAASVSNCTFASNAISGGWSGFVVASTLVADCDFIGNKVDYDGILNSNGGIVTNCTFISNTVGSQGRGAICNPASVIDCVVTGTRGYHGAGVILSDASVHSYVKDSYFANNECSAGGCGAYMFVDLKDKTAADVSVPYMTFDHCTFETNSIANGKHGGAILNGAKNVPAGVAPESLVVCSNNCQFIRNRASHAGGVEGVTAIGCTFVDNQGGGNGFNYLGDAAALSRLVDCDITGGNIYRCSLDRCNIHTITNTGVFNSWNFVTNTLITGCDLPTSGALIGRYTSGQAEDAGGEYVNCTFAGNKCLTFFNVDTANYATFKNCVFAENKDQKGDATSLSADNTTRTAWDSPLFAFDHCAYGPIAGTTATPAPTGEGVFLCTNPRFNAGKDPDQPRYAPRYGSSLRAAGDPAPYAADDLDLAGAPRLRDGKVSIGCYECWADPVGLMLLFR